MKKMVLVSLVAWAALAAPTAAHGHAAREPVATAASSAVVSQSGEVEHVMQRPGSTGGHVVVEGNRLYMGMYGAGLRIFDITKPDEPTELGTWTPADSGLGPVPVADAPPDAAVFDGRHIAVVNGTGRTTSPFPSQARTDHSYFLDTTDPANSSLLWSFEGPEDGESHNGDIVDSRRLWLPSGEGGENGLRIYDLNPLLQNPPAPPVAIFRGDPAAMWESSPYLAGRDPGGGFTHTHDITVYPDFEVGGVKRDIALLAEGGNYTSNAGNTGSMFVIDITNPRAPVVLLRWLHSTEAPHKPIRYHHEAQFLHGDPRVVLVTDEDLHNGCDAGGVTALRLSQDLTEATELSEWFIANDLPAGTTFGPICSVHVFSSHGNLVYFGSYNAGLQVVDYSNPSAPKRIGHNEQPGANSWGAEYLRDGLVYVGDFGGRGLDVFRYGGPVPDLAVLTPTLEDKGKPSQRLVTTVANQGELASGAVAFEFRDGDRVIGRQTVPPLAPGATHPVPEPWNTRNVRGDRTITAVVDAGDRLDEAKEDNNERSAMIPDPGSGAGGSDGVLRVSLKVQRTRLARAARSGLTLRVTCSRSCRGTVALQLDRRAARKLGLGRKATTVGRRTFTLASKGTRSLRVRVSRRARRAVARARSVRLSAVARATDSQRSKTVRVRRAVTLKR